MENNTHVISSFTHCFRMVGDSMNGGGKRGFIDGDILQCDEVDFRDIKVDKCNVISCKGGETVTKVVAFDGEHIITAPFNLSYPGREFTKEEVQSIYMVKAVQRKVCDDIDL